MPDCRLFLVSEKGSKAAEANEGFCDLVLVDRYYSDEFGKALSSIACSGCDRIICNSEDDVERVAAVRSQYAVPGMKLPLAEGFRDKYSMKSLFSAASLPSTGFALVDSGNRRQYRSSRPDRKTRGHQHDLRAFIGRRFHLRRSRARRHLFLRASEFIVGHRGRVCPTALRDRAGGSATTAEKTVPRCLRIVIDSNSSDSFF